MNVKELKKLIHNSTAVLVLDNGEPSFVIMDYNMYKDLISEKEGKDIKINQGNGLSHQEISHQETEMLVDRLNKEILALKSQIEAEEKGLASSAPLAPPLD